jgi:ferric-dicitrate binding protein FerR (iron transport regulator)
VSDRLDEHGTAEKAAQNAVRALAQPRAEASFRARLRHEFTTGRFGRRVPAYRPRPWWALKRVLVPLAAGVLVVAGVTLNRGPNWRIVAADGDGRVAVDGVREVGMRAPGDRALAARIARGGLMVTDSTLTLHLVAPGVAAVTLAPGTEVMLSSAPGRWWGRSLRAQVRNGDAYFTTGRAFHGAHLDVSTPEVSVRAVGTAFAVLRDPAGATCVCVMEGRVRVGTAGAAPASAVDVPAGMRRIVQPGYDAETEPILDQSVHRLHHQRDVTGSLLGR